MGRIGFNNIAYYGWRLQTVRDVCVYCKGLFKDSIIFYKFYKYIVRLLLIIRICLEKPEVILKEKNWSSYRRLEGLSTDGQNIFIEKKKRSYWRIKDQKITT